MLLICDGLLRVFIKVENSRFQLVAPSSKDLDIAFKGGSPLKCTVRNCYNRAECQSSIVSLTSSGVSCVYSSELQGCRRS
ncbi:hypothetical protein PS15p_200060 [Mucor circinelloides]